MGMKKCENTTYDVVIVEVMMELSYLNVVPVRQGQTPKQAMDSMVKLAQGLEDIGYARYWIAEHHNTKNFASSATSLLIEHTLEHTKTIRVGAGGVMLPNHSPYIVAETYGTLETLFPGRVDLGLGRAPGTDMNTARAIRRTGNLYSDFGQEVLELESYFRDTAPVHAYPAAGLDVPFYILGSSTESAYLAAALGLPYAFASHFAPAMMRDAVRIYLSEFKPSSYMRMPYVILGCNAIVADTDEEAKMLQTSMLQGFISIITGRDDGLKPPVKDADAVWNDFADEIIQSVPHFGPVAFNKMDLVKDHKRVLEDMTAMSFVGSPETVAKEVAKLKSEVQFNELMVNSFIYDEAAQLKSLKLFKEAVDSIGD